MYLPMVFILPYGVGCVLNMVVERARGTAWSEDKVVPAAAGLMVGESVLAVVVALLAVAGLTAAGGESVVRRCGQRKKGGYGDGGDGEMVKKVGCGVGRLWRDEKGKAKGKRKKVKVMSVMGWVLMVMGTVGAMVAAAR